MFIDSHAHLEFQDFANDLDQVLERAREAGVTRVVTVGSGRGMAKAQEAVSLAERHPNLWAVVGFHPHEAQHITDQDLADLAQLARHPRVVGIGETGLDYHYHFSEPAVQQRIFRRQLELSQEVDKPVVIHTREAEADTRALLDEVGLPAAGGVLHCFTSSPELARYALDTGFFLSFSGIITFRNAAEVHQVVRDTPLDRILIETDSPYLAPIPHRGRRNEPGYVVEVAKKVAELKAIPLEEVAAATTRNAERLFRLPEE